MQWGKFVGLFYYKNDTLAKTMNSSKRLAKNTAIQIGGKLMATISGVVTVGILSRYLGTSGYGDFTFVLTFLSIFAVLVDFGLTLTTTQMISEKKADEEKLLGNLLSLRIVSAAVFLGLAPVLAIFLPGTEGLLIAIAVGAMSYLFGTTAQMMIGVFQKRLIMWQAVLAESANRTLVLFGVIAAPFFGFDLVGILWLFVIGNAAQLFTMLFFARRQVSFKPAWDMRVLKEVLHRSWPIGASIFFNLIYLKGDVLFLFLYRSSAEVGLYGAAYKVVDVMTSIPVMYMGITLPILALAVTSRNKKGYEKTMQSTFDFFTIIALPFIFGSIALGVPVMEMISGSEFTESGQVLKILGPAASIVFFGSLYGHTIVALNKQKPMTLAYFIVAVITVAGYLILIPRYGMYGAAWMTVIAELIIGIISFIVVVKVGKHIPRLTIFFKAAAAGLLMYLTLGFLPDTFHVLVDIGLASLTYFVVLSALGGFKPIEVFKLFLPEKPPLVS